MIYIGSEVWETMKLADLWFKGIPPVSGGALQQSKSFFDAAYFILGEENFWKNKLGILT
jgi:hypothetical protein